MSTTVRPAGRAYATPDLAGSEQQGLVVGDGPLIENMSVGTDRGTAALKDRRAMQRCRVTSRLTRSLEASNPSHQPFESCWANCATVSFARRSGLTSSSNINPQQISKSGTPGIIMATADPSAELLADIQLENSNGERRDESIRSETTNAPP